MDASQNVAIGNTALTRLGLTKHRGLLANFGGATLIIVRHILGQDPLQMPLVPNEQMVETLRSNRSHPAMPSVLDRASGQSPHPQK